MCFFLCFTILSESTFKFLAWKFGSIYWFHMGLVLRRLWGLFSGLCENRRKGRYWYWGFISARRARASVGSGPGVDESDTPTGATRGPVIKFGAGSPPRTRPGVCVDKAGVSPHPRPPPLRWSSRQMSAILPTPPSLTARHTTDFGSFCVNPRFTGLC